MTKEVFESIRKFEKDFGWAINNNFLHLSVGEFNEIARAYLDTFGTPLTKTQMTCNACKLNAVKKLGAEYFKAKEEYEEKDDDSEGKEEKEEKKKNKVGRPPKIKLED